MYLPFPILYIFVLILKKSHLSDSYFYFLLNAEKVHTEIKKKKNATPKWAMMGPVTSGINSSPTNNTFHDNQSTY